MDVHNENERGRLGKRVNELESSPELQKRLLAGDDEIREFRNCAAGIHGSDFRNGLDSHINGLWQARACYETSLDGPVRPSDRFAFITRNLKDSIEPRDVQQSPQVIRRTQQDQLSGPAFNGGQDSC